MVGEGLSSAHVHIGPGRLGLGLIVAAGLEAGLDVHLVARTTSSVPSAPRFKALVKGESGEESKALPVATFSKSDTLEALPEDVRDLVSHTPELLITTAATTTGLEELHGFLLRIADVRAGSPAAERTIFIPCENDTGTSYNSLRSGLEGFDVECRDTLVNRLCTEIRIHEDDTTHEVVVDELAEWVIEGQPDHQHALNALRRLPYVEFVDDVRPYETRKRWLVNGAHLALAILAHANRVTSIDAAAAEPGRTRWLEKLHAVLIESLDLRYPGLEDNQAYAASHVAAWMRHEDEVIRIMKRLRRANPLPFFDDLERKLIEPIVSLENPYERFPTVRYVLNRLHRVLQRATSYVDYEDLPAILPTLDRSIDVRTASRYRELLEPIVGAEEARNRAESLGVSLDLHRLRG
jgi:hypothetical protein